MFTEAQKVRRFFKVALFGEAKVGKTYAALSFPNACVIDTERGSLPYADRFQFSVKELNRWVDLGNVLKWLEKNPKAFDTLIIDSLTVFYQDLIDQQTEWVKNRRNSEILSTGDWGIIKRRWKSFMNRLVDLDMNVVLVMRSKDEYDSKADHTGEEKRFKTGEKLMDADKSTKYLFDIILQLSTERNKKAKQTKHFVHVDGSRIEGIQQYDVHDITKKSLYKVMFKSLENEVTKGAALPPRPQDDDAPGTEPKKKAPRKKKGEKDEKKEAPKPETPPIPPNEMEMRYQTLEKFGTQGSKDCVPATGDDIKVLMTRAGKMEWPDGKAFRSKDGKAMIKTLCGVEESKQLQKWQIMFLDEEFGNVLAGRGYLALGDNGVPYIAQGEAVSTF